MSICGLDECLIYNRRVYSCQYDDINNVKLGTLPINIDKTLEALHTQYQFRSDAIVARHSADAPTLEQLGMIRDAHLNIITILIELQAYKNLVRNINNKKE